MGSFNFEVEHAWETSGCHAQCHLASSGAVARLCRISSPFPLITSLWLVHRLEQRLSSCEHGEGTLLGDGTVCVSPCFLSFPNLAWTDGASSGCGSCLLGRLHGKCLNSGQESLPEPLRGAGCWPTAAGSWTRLPVEIWPGEEAAEQRAVLSELRQHGGQASKDTWISPRPISSLWRNTKLCTENFLQKANFFSCVTHPSLTYLAEWLWIGVHFADEKPLLWCLIGHRQNQYLELL